MKNLLNEMQAKYKEMVNAHPPFYVKPSYSIKDLAKDLGTNRTYASRFVNQTMGVKFTDLLSELRLSYLLELHKEQPGATITWLAHQSGFSNMFSFRRTFFKKFGTTPTEYLGRKK